MTKYRKITKSTNTRKTLMSKEAAPTKSF